MIISTPTTQNKESGRASNRLTDTIIQFVRVRSVSYISEKDFEDLFIKEHEKIYRYLLSSFPLLEQDAEDVTEQTFLKAWEIRYKLNNDKNDAYYVPRCLFTIAKNIVIDDYRHDKNRTLNPDADTFWDTLPASETLEDQFERNEQEQVLNKQEQDLLAILQSLPEQDRDVLIQHYILGQKLKDIAKTLGLAAAAIRKRKQRALNKLAEEWCERKENNE